MQLLPRAFSSTSSRVTASVESSSTCGGKKEAEREWQGERASETGRGADSRGLSRAAEGKAACCCLVQC